MSKPFILSLWARQKQAVGPLACGPGLWRPALGNIWCSKKISPSCIYRWWQYSVVIERATQK